MTDPLSVIASIAGVVAIGTQVTQLLITTIDNTRSASQSISSLSKELDLLCKALGNLETILAVPDVLKYPHFPVQILSDVIDSIKTDFDALQKEIENHVAKPGAGSLKQFWRQFRWQFREEDICSLRDNIAAYKATIIMTISAANFATTCASDLASSAHFNRLHERITELTENVAYCMHVNNGLRSAEPRNPPGQSSRMPIHTTISRASFRLSGRPCDENVTETKDSVFKSGGRSTASLRTVRSRSSGSSSLDSYRAGSILDQYCESIRCTTQLAIQEAIQTSQAMQGSAVPSMVDNAQYSLDATATQDLIHQRSTAEDQDTNPLTDSGRGLSTNRRNPNPPPSAAPQPPVINITRDTNLELTTRHHPEPNPILATSRTNFTLAGSASDVPYANNRDHAVKKNAGPSLWHEAFKRVREEDLEALNGTWESNTLSINDLISGVCSSRRDLYGGFYFADVFRRLDKFSAIMDIAIQHNPEVTALVWAGVKLLLQAGSARTSNIMNLVSSSLNYITLVIESGEVYERLYIQSAHPLTSRLRECLVDQYVKVLIYLACVKKHPQKNIMKRFAERELSGLLDEVRESGKRVNDYVDLAEKSRLGPLQLIRESDDSQTTQQRNTSGEPSDGHETRDQISSFLNETRQD